MRSLTAMSASDTGDDVPLVQVRNWVRNIARARCPASRTVSTSRARSRAKRSLRPSTLASANRQSLDAYGRRVGRIAECEIVGRRQRLEHLDQMPGDGDFADRIRDFAVLDPEPGGT